MYKIAADLSQRRSRQLWLADLQGGEFESLPAEEQRANLVRAKIDLESKMLKLPKKHPERVEIGQRLLELNTKINAIRAKLKGPRNTPEFFIEVARERMNPFLFSAFMKEAAIRARAKFDDGEEA